MRTNLDVKDEIVVWNIYNTIREIENAFRTLKTDLDLRPIYHKNDDATMAHLHLVILAYWLVNTVRYQLKNYAINSCWREIIRIGNTRKVITTTGTNTYDKIFTTRKCTQYESMIARSVVGVGVRTIISEKPNLPFLPLVSYFSSADFQLFKNLFF